MGYPARMRWLLLTLLTMGATGCAGFKAVARGQWKLVYADSAKRDAEAPREVVTRETYDAEVAEGVRRGYEPPIGFGFPLLQEADGIGMKVGEVQGFRVDGERPISCVEESRTTARPGSSTSNAPG